MNKSFLLSLVFLVPLAHGARADDRDYRSRRRPAQAAQVQSAGQEQAVRTAPRQGVQRMTPLNSPRRISSVSRSSNRDTVRRPAVPNSRPVYNRPATRRTTSTPVVDGRSRNRDRSSNPRVTKNAGPLKNRSNANSRLANRSVNRNSFAIARNRVVRGNHNRHWWRNHCPNTTFVIFGGGYYYWDAGYWFPAYGYDTYYNNYAYNEPIYGYNDLAPGQVLENVQIALRDLGYYNGPIDGLIGEQTRAALGDYQSDNGLVITEAVDEPTLVALGLA